MGVPKIVVRDGREYHQSVGAWIEYNGGYIVIDRMKKPFGLAGIAGHVDEGETSVNALFREVKEETGLDITSYTHIVKNDLLEFNVCSKGMVGHVWDVYLVKAKGELLLKADEVKSIGLYSKQSVLDNYTKGNFEEAWDYMFKNYKNTLL